MSVMTELPEQEIVERCLAGKEADHSAFRILYERYAPEVQRFLRRMLRDRESVEDALQETFLRLHRGLGRFDKQRPLRPYVLRIARNTAIETLRRRQKVERIKQAPRPPGSDLGVIERAALNERELLVHEALAALPPEHKTVVVLRYTHGLKLREIGEALDCTSRTARNRLRAAAVLLERELKKLGVVSDEVNP